MHSMKKHKFGLLFGMLATSFASVSVAQTTSPDAGSLLQQFERERKPDLPRKALPISPAEPEAMQPLFGVIITVNQFHLAGNKLLGTELLQSALASYLDRPLDYTQLQAAAAAVAEVYRAAGWVVRAYLPQQDIVGGVVTIQIVEAAFGGVRFEGEAAPYVALARILGIFNAQQQVGAALNAHATDRALLLASDLPGVIVSGNLHEGAQPGQTDIIIKLANAPLVGVGVDLDNTGSRSTGADRVSANLNVNSALGQGDLISSSLIHTEGSEYVRLGITAPVGSDGWRAGVNASDMHYKLVSSDFATANITGTSNTVGLEASYPLIRTRLANLYFQCNADYKKYDNLANGASTTYYDNSSLSMGLSGNVFDKFGGGGSTNVGVTVTNGDLNLSKSPNLSNDAISSQTNGTYTKLRYSASRQQVVTEDVSFAASVSGQLASKNLDSSEKFYLGGSSGVRAYPSSEGGGAEGALLNLELRWRLPEGFNITGFYDYGQVKANVRNNFASATPLNEYSLQGAGLTLAWQHASGLSLKATWAKRIGNNPNPTATGTDQDGSFATDRFWLTASMPF